MTQNILRQTFFHGYQLSAGDLVEDGTLRNLAEKAFYRLHQDVSKLSSLYSFLLTRHSEGAVLRQCPPNCPPGPPRTWRVTDGMATLL